MTVPAPKTIPHEWLIALGLLLFVVLFGSVLSTEFGAGAGDEVILPALASPTSDASRLSVDAGAVLLTGAPGRDVVTRLHVVLPKNDSQQSRWVVWIGRAPVDALMLQRGDWHSDTRGFFRPSPLEGPMPSGFAFALPWTWEGEVDLELHAQSSVRTVLRPRLVRADTATRLNRQGAVIATGLYAGLLTLAILALALFSAARDRLFFALFAYAVLTLLALAAANGHLYQLRGLGALSGWGSAGLLAVGMLYAAAQVQMLALCTDLRMASRRAMRAVDGGSLVLVLLAAVCLVDLPELMGPMQYFAGFAWLATCLGSVWLLVVAARRGIRIARWLTLSLVVCTVGSLVLDLVMRGAQPDTVWARYGYQLGIVALTTTLAVGLVSRISKFRDQRDSERLARADADRRMLREAARSDLNAGLQVSLRNCKEDEIEWVGLRMLLDRLAPQLSAGEGSVMVEGYHGLDLLVGYPAQDSARVRERVIARRLALKRLAVQGIALQQPQATLDASASATMMEALVPLPIGQPAWGMLLLSRDGSEGFTTEEMALASECARLTMTHVDQAKSAVSLRRSAELDALTGTFNRRTIDLWTARVFDEAVRDKQPMSVLFVDLDYFKAINDKYGHACGDQCLREVAAAIRAQFGNGELIGRYGGEEFIIVLAGHGGAAARTIGERLRLAIETLDVHWDGHVLRLTVSVGVATRIEGEKRAAETVDRADKALYAAKRGGRNRVHVAPAVFS